MIFLILTAGLLALLIILLCIPLEIEVHGNFQNEHVVKARIFYLFRALEWKVGLRRKKTSNEHLATASSDSGWIGLPEVLELVQIEGILERVFKLIQKLINSIKVQHVEADLRLSLGDDYDTGMLFGLLIPLKLYLQPSPQYNIMLQPAFEEDLLLSGKIYADWQVRPIEVLAHCLAFVCSRPAWRAATLVISYRCKKKY